MIESKMDMLQALAIDWARRCFGWQHVSDPKVRAMRLVEEAIELCQALDVSTAQVMRCVEIVYARPHGDARQELWRRGDDSGSASSSATHRS